MKEEILEGGIKIFRHPDYISVNVDFNLISKVSSFIKLNNIKSIYFTGGKPILENDYSFLSDWNNIESMAINTNDIKVVHFPKLPNIKELVFNNYSLEVEMEKFPELARLTLDWNQKIKNIDACKQLTNLVIWKYNPKEKNLIPLSNLTGLQHLEIHNSNITSLKGVEGLKSLKELELHYATKLLDISSISQLKDNLHELFVDNSKKINGHNAVQALKNLRLLVFNDCGNIDSFDFVNDLAELRELRFVGSNLVDGNLLPCVRLNRVIFNNKRHYSHRFEGFNN